MTDRFELDVEGIPEVALALQEFPGAAKRAIYRALKTTTAYASSQVRRKITADKGFPLKSLTEGRRVIPDVRPEGTTGTLWIGYTHIKPRFLGTLKQTPEGVKVGSIFFEGAFITKKSKRVMKRPPHKRHPLTEQFVELQNVPSIVESLLPDIQDRFERAVEKELNYALNIEARE